MAEPTAVHVDIHLRAGSPLNHKILTTPSVGEFVTLNLGGSPASVAVIVSDPVALDILAVAAARAAAALREALRG